MITCKLFLHLTNMFFALFLVTFLAGCWGGGGDNNNSETPPPSITADYNCGAGELAVTDGLTESCVLFTKIDIDNDGLMDGFDFDTDGVPEAIFVDLSTQQSMGVNINGEVPPGAHLVDPTIHQVTGLDLNGNGIADYYLWTDENGRHVITPKADGTGTAVVVVVDKKGVVLGFDLNGDGTLDDATITAIRADKTSPKVAPDLVNGIYGVPQEVTVHCADDVACNAIVYTLDGMDPVFGVNGIVVIGNVFTLTIGEGGEGPYRLKFMARDSAGNLSTVGVADYMISSVQCPTPLVAVGGGYDVNQGGQALLDGRGTYILYGTVEAYTWTQVLLGDAPDVTGGAGFLNGATPAFTAPDKVTTVVFQLVVTDNYGCNSNPDRVQVHVMKDKDNAVFVDGLNGSDANDGSRSAPLQTLAAAAGDGTVRDIYMTHTAAVNGAALVDRSLFGGFGADWVRDGAWAKSVINGGINLDAASSVEISRVDISGPAGVAHSVGLLATLTDGALALSQVRIAGGTPITDSGSSYGLVTSGTGSVEVRQSQISTASGDAGADKPAQSPAADGADGAAGDPTTCLTWAGAFGGWHNENGGAGYAGGTAGDGAYAGEGYPYWGNDGKGPLGGAVGGLGKSYDWPFLGTAGGRGGDGGNGSDGAMVLNHASAYLSLNAGATTFAPALASAGVGGRWGSGGGGGGGSGAQVGAFKTGGNGGGGGGQGGGARAGGQGGGGGGGAFAVLLNHAGSTLLEQNTISASNAGAGGAGGIGGLGGAGGSGGAGGNGCILSTGAGGAGGTGGKGGDATAGGGGGGGPSIAVWLRDGQPYEITGNTLTVGNGGGGGGGYSHASFGSGGGNGGPSWVMWARGGNLPSPTITDNAFTQGTPGAGGTGEKIGFAGSAGTANFAY